MHRQLAAAKLSVFALSAAMAQTPEAAPAPTPTKPFVSVCKADTLTGATLFAPPEAQFEWQSPRTGQTSLGAICLEEGAPEVLHEHILRAFDRLTLHVERNWGFPVGSWPSPYGPVYSPPPEPAQGGCRSSYVTHAYEGTLYRGVVLYCPKPAGQPALN